MSNLELQNQNGMFILKNKNFGKLYTLVESILETRNYEGSQEYVLAKALQERLDFAIDTEEKELVFNDIEVECICALLEQ